MDAGTHRYFDTLSNEFDGALKVIAVNDEAIVLTTAATRLSPPSTNGMPGSLTLLLTHFYLPQTSP